MAIRRAMVKWCAVFLGATASVIPYGANSRTIAKELRGKVPGTLNKRTGLWVGTAGAMAGRFMTMTEAEQADKDGAAVGILAEHYPFIDIDVEDARLAAGVLVLAFEILGPGPIRRREGSPRCGVMYAGLNIRKRTLKWGGDKEQGIKDNGVEVLGRGQYWNADGLHPSGLPYYWDDPHPCDLGPFDLTVITMEMVEAFMAAVRALLEGRGFTVVASGAGKREGLSTGTRNSLDNPSLWAPSPEAVLDLLASYRPEGHMPHDQFLQHMVAIKAALGPDREDYYANVLEWAPGVRSTEHEATRKRWDSINDATIGWPWLCQKAGYVGADYDDPPPDITTPDPGKTMFANIQANWVYVLKGSCFFNVRDKGSLSKDGFNAEFIKLAVYGKSGPNSAVARIINHPATRKTREITYRPQHIEEQNPDKFLILHEPPESGITAFNTWVPPHIIPIRGVEPSGAWFEHLHRGMPLEAERNHFLDWWAFVFQHPGIKINHALVLISSLHGTGKDLIYLPFFRAIGSQNVRTVRPDSIGARFSPHMMSQIIYVSEMTDFSEKKSDYNKMKMVMASPPEYLPMELKGKDIYWMPNIQNWVFASNHANAISLEPADRRFWVQLFAVGLENENYFLRIGEDIDKRTGEIIGFVLDRKIDHFNPYAPPPMTEAKAEMIMLARSPVARWLDAQFEIGGQWEKKVFMTVPFVLEIAQGFNVPEAVARGIHKGHIEAAFRQHGFELIEGKHRIDDKVTRVWTRDKHFRTASGKLLAAQVEADWKKR